MLHIQKPNGKKAALACAKNKISRKYYRQDSLRGDKSQQQSSNSSEHFPVAWRNLTGLKHVLYLSCFTSSSIRTNESDWQKIGQIKQSFIKVGYIFIEVQLIQNVLLLSGVQQSKVIQLNHIYIIFMLILYSFLLWFITGY